MALPVPHGNTVSSSPETGLHVDSVRGKQVRPFVYDGLVHQQDLHLLESVCRVRRVRVASGARMGSEREPKRISVRTTLWAVWRKRKHEI